MLWYTLEEGEVDPNGKLFLRKIKSSRGAKDRSELSELSQTESQADLIRAISTDRIPSSLYSQLTVAIWRRSATRSILSQGITEMGEIEALEKAERVCVCDRE